MNSNESLKRSFIFPLLIIILTWPLLGGYVTLFARSWIWLLIGCLSVFFVCPSYRYQKGMVWILLYLFMVMYNYFTGDAYFNSFPVACSEFAILFFSSALGYFCLLPENRKSSKTILWVLSFIIIITSFATFLLDLTNPGIVRQATSELFDMKDLTILNWGYRMGMTNYSLPHALPVIIPALVYGIKNHSLNVRSRLFLSLFLFAVFMLIYVSGVATAIIVSFIVFIISFFSSTNRAQNNIQVFIIVGIILVPILLNQQWLADMLNYFISLTGEGYLHDRLVDILESMIYKDASGDLEARLDLYSVSSTEFAESILFGSNNNLGGHSAIIDRLATMGLVGIVPYILFIGYQLNTSYKKIPQCAKTFYVEGILAGLMMLITKNMSNWEMWTMLFVLLPTIIMQFGDNNRTKKINN